MPPLRSRRTNRPQPAARTDAPDRLPAEGVPATTVAAAQSGMLGQMAGGGVPVMQLQSMIGNQAVAGVMAAGAPVQRKVYTPPQPAGATAAEVTTWNALLQKAEDAGVLDAIADWVSEQEGEMYTAGFGTAAAIAQLRTKIGTELANAKLASDGADVLDWDEMKGFIDTNLGGSTYCTVNWTAGTGGHSADTWSVRAKSDTSIVEMGSIPRATHGSTTGELNGARGAIKKAIRLHNEEVDKAIAAV